MELFDYIEVFYNQRRRHSTLGQISPAAFERRADSGSVGNLSTESGQAHTVPAEVDEFRKEIDFLKPFGPIDLAFLSVYGHNNRVGTAYEPYLYLLDQLSPRAIYLAGANNPEQYPRCVEVLRARGIPVVYPEEGRAKGERFHYLRDRARRQWR